MPKGKQTELKPEFKYEKLEDGSLFRFESIGDAFEGKYLSVGKSSKYPNMNIYEFEDAAGEPVRILGSSVLDRLMARVAIGRQVKIVFADEKATQKGNPMKLFDVYVAE
jgi:hypothetical protein